MIHTRAIGAMLLAGLLPGCILVHARTVEEPAASVAPVAAPPAVIAAPAPTPVAAPTGSAPLQVANPNYVTIPM